MRKWLRAEAEESTQGFLASKEHIESWGQLYSSTRFCHPWPGYCGKRASSPVAWLQSQSNPAQFELAFHFGKRKLWGQTVLFAMLEITAETQHTWLCPGCWGGKDWETLSEASTPQGNDAWTWGGVIASWQKWLSVGEKKKLVKIIPD